MPILCNQIYIHGRRNMDYRTLGFKEIINSRGEEMTLVEYEDLENKRIFFRTVEHFEKSFKLAEYPDNWNKDK